MSADKEASFVYGNNILGLRSLVRLRLKNPKIYFEVTVVVTEKKTNF